MRPTAMRNRYAALAVVIAFVGATSAAALLAARGGGDELDLAGGGQSPPVPAATDEWLDRP